MVQDDEPVGLDGLRVRFDDERVVSDAGVVLVATVAERLGIEALAGGLVRLRRGRPGAANAGRKVMALIFAMVLGADSIDNADVLQAGRTRRLLGGWLPAPSTLGTFLRAFTFGHVRRARSLLPAHTPIHPDGSVKHTQTIQSPPYTNPRHHTAAATHRLHPTEPPNRWIRA
jgi:hypothetical protein